jgi:hypothetical protein
VQLLSGLRRRPLLPIAAARHLHPRTTARPPPAAVVSDGGAGPCDPSTARALLAGAQAGTGAIQHDVPVHGAGQEHVVGLQVHRQAQAAHPGGRGRRAARDPDHAPPRRPPSIVDIEGAYEDPLYVHIVMELYKGGSPSRKHRGEESLTSHVHHPPAAAAQARQSAPLASRAASAWSGRSAASAWCPYFNLHTSN